MAAGSPEAANGTPRPSNGNALRGTGILNNELYIGRLVWNRLRYVKDPATGKRISRLNEPDQWITQDVPELRIVPQDRWDQVKARQQMLKRNTRPDRAGNPFRERQRPRFLIPGSPSAAPAAPAT